MIFKYYANYAHYITYGIYDLKQKIYTLKRNVVLLQMKLWDRQTWSLIFKFILEKFVWEKGNIPGSFLM